MTIRPVDHYEYALPELKGSVNEYEFFLNQTGKVNWSSNFTSLTVSQIMRANTGIQQGIDLSNYMNGSSIKYR